MPGFDYSKWDNIELSDSEDDLHPNIDKESWFRMKHRDRVDREADEGKRQKELETRLKKVKAEIQTFGEAGSTHMKAKKLQEECNSIEEELAKMEKNKKWNADNMCKTVESKSEVSSRVGPEPKPEPRLKGEEATSGYVDFVEQNEALLEKYISLGSEEFEVVMEFLREHAEKLLVGEHAETYLLLDCLEKEMNGEHKAMLKSARQNQLITQLREYSRASQRPVQDGILPVFTRIIEHDGTREAFEESVDTFVKRIEKRAVEKKKEMDKERLKEDASSAELGPGGLNPIEVLHSLPKDMREAFEEQDIERLQEVIEAMDVDEAKYHLRRCEDSGLWVPGEAEENPPYRQ
mmetsp:Transcript_57726/g.137378  ORF Transcript_57726/g.137378 Transcript_57726/m.137378 type:complete len:349 (+) Transcript_57726:92-1138(+)